MSTSPSVVVGYGCVEHLPTVANDSSLDEHNALCSLSEYIMPTIASDSSKVLNLQPSQNFITVPTGLETPPDSRLRDQGLITSSVLAPNPLSYLSEYDISSIRGCAPDQTRYPMNVGNDNATLSLCSGQSSTNESQIVKIDEYQEEQVIFGTGSYKCHYPECSSRGGYKQKEHLVRHIHT